MFACIEKVSSINVIPLFQGTTRCDGGLVWIVCVWCVCYSGFVGCHVKVYYFPLKEDANYNWETIERGTEQIMLTKYDCRVFSNYQLNGFAILVMVEVRGL